MIKPTNVDAQRVLQVLSELKERLTCLSVITPEVLEVALEKNPDFPQDFLKRAEEQCDLEDAYLMGLSYDEPDPALMEKVTKGVLDLCRRMAGKKEIVSELRNFQDTKGGNLGNLIKTLAQLEELTLTRLTTTVEEERSKAQLQNHIMQKYEAATKKKEQLVKTLEQVRRERERESRERESVITKLKNDLKNLSQHTQQLHTTQHETYTNRMTEMQAAFDKREIEYKKQIEAGKTQKKTLVASSTEDEGGLRRRKMRGERDLEDTVNQYDEAMLKLKEEYESQSKAYKKELLELRELDDHFQKVDEDIAQNLKEQELTELRTQVRLQKQERISQAASALQSYYRGLIAREEFVRARKGKKGKKGKKK